MLPVIIFLNTDSDEKWKSAQPNKDGTAAYWSKGALVYDTKQDATNNPFHVACVQQVINKAQASVPVTSNNQPTTTSTTTSTASTTTKTTSTSTTQTEPTTKTISMTPLGNMTSRA